MQYSLQRSLQLHLWLVSTMLCQPQDLHPCCFTINGTLMGSHASLFADLVYSLTAFALHSRPAQLRTVSSVQSQHSGAIAAVSAAEAALDPLAALKQSAAAAAPSAPAETVETRLPLPAADFAEPVLSVTTDFPPSATAGQSFR